MKHKSIYFVSLMVAFFLTSCSQDEPLCDFNTDRPLEISVSDSGFQTESRSVENGFSTQFTIGDQCGLYIVNNGTVIGDNIKITASKNEDGSLKWDSENEIRGGGNGGKYYLYYPYQSDMAGKVDPSAATVNDFFANLINTWSTKADQSSYADYTASDLMVSEGLLNDQQLSFSMMHCMALVSITVPEFTYTFTDKTIPDVTLPAVVDFSYGNVTPFRMANGTYRLICNYRLISPTITGRYLNGKKEFTITTSNLRSGCCMLGLIRDESLQSNPIVCQLKAGDYFCKDSGNNWYVIPQEAGPDSNVIGIVFYAGFEPTDKRSYYYIFYDDCPSLPDNVFHGYVMALTDTNIDSSDLMYWLSYSNGFYNLDISTSKSFYDWAGGYNNNQMLFWLSYHFKAGLDERNYMAFGSCLKYANRDFDATGNASTAYSWQKPLFAPNNTSSWFLPSSGQLKHMAENREILSHSLDEVKKNTPVDRGYRDYIRWFSSDYDYWSSSEFDGENAYYINMATKNINYATKDKLKGTRPILAF